MPEHLSHSSSKDQYFISPILLTGIHMNRNSHVPTFQKEGVLVTILLL